MDQGTADGPLDRCRARVAELAELEDFWHDGFGKAPSPASIVVAYGLLEREPRLVPLYHIFPVTTGGVSFEFVLDGWDRDFEIDASGLVAVCGTEIRGEGYVETLPLDPADLGFVRRIENLAAKVP